MKKTNVKFVVIVLFIVLLILCCLFFLISKKESKSAEQLDLGNKAFLEMEYDDVILYCQKAIELDPKNVDAYLLLAEAYMALDDYTSAYDYLLLGYENTNDVAIWNMMQDLLVARYVELGGEYLSEGNPNAAKDAFEKALEKEPDNETAKEGLTEAENHPEYDPDSEVDVDNLESEKDTNDDNFNGNDDSDNNTANDNSANNSNDAAPEEFNPYGFTFLGYPVHEDHYEDWKAVVGYTGNDDMSVGDNNAPGNGYGEALQFCTDGSQKIFSLVDGFVTEPYVMMDTLTYWGINTPIGPFKITFSINPNKNYRDVAAANFDGPIKIGTSLTDALQAIGYEGDISALENNYYMMEDGTTLGITSIVEHQGEGANPVEKYLYIISNNDYYLSFGFINDVIEQLTLQYN